MKKLLFIDHSYHVKTKSTQFILDLLSTHYDIKKFFFDPYCDSFDIFKSLKGEVFDIVILGQIMPPINRLKKLISFKHIVFFPMYDGAPPLTDKIWYEYKDCNIINFSETLHKECKKYGLSSFYIQYFPKPEEILDWGDERSVFLWQRIRLINPDTVDKVIGFENINKFYHHQVPDPEQEIINVDKNWENKTEISGWFDTEEELGKYLQKSAIYFAPRHQEGIGMSFLNAMALGRCVVAPDNPTMNEYIKDGANGYLYDLENTQKISIKNVREIQKNTVQFIEHGYRAWEENKKQILSWIVSDAAKNRNYALIKKKYSERRPLDIKKTLLYRAARKLYRIAKKIVRRR